MVRAESRLTRDKEGDARDTHEAVQMRPPTESSIQAATSQ